MRDRRWIGALVLVLGVALVLGGVVLAGARVALAADVVRETGVDFGSAYLLGTEGGPFDLVASIAPIVLMLAGIVVAALAYRRVVTSGESVAMVRIGWHPFASREAVREAGRGRY